MFFAAAKGRAKVAKLLLDCGANPNMQDKAGSLPLTVAVYNNHPKVVKLLLENGADINKKNGNGLNALQLARTMRNRELIDLLTPYSN